MYNGKKYVYLCGKHENKDRYIGKKCIQVNVLQRNLKGRTDLQGRLYTPSEFIFICEGWKFLINKGCKVFPYALYLFLLY